MEIGESPNTVVRGIKQSNETISNMFAHSFPNSNKSDKQLKMFGVGFLIFGVVFLIISIFVTTWANESPFVVYFIGGLFIVGGILSLAVVYYFGPKYFQKKSNTVVPESNRGISPIKEE